MTKAPTPPNRNQITQPINFGGTVPRSTTGPPPPPALTTPAQTSAYQLFENLLQSYGLPTGADIETIIKNAVIQGITPDQISLILPQIQQTQTWNNRFPAWEQYVKNGYNQMDVASYLNLENQYHSILQSAGLPKSFYDDPSDYANWIANGVSPDEVQTRVSDATTLVNQVDPTAKDLLTKFYGVTSGDLTAYFLDPSRALPALNRQYNAVNVAAFAQGAGLQVQDSSHYEDLVDKGVTPSQAAQGYGTVAQLTGTLGELGNIYGDKYTQNDAENDVFFNDSAKRQSLVSKEQATFSGQSSGSTGSVARTNY